MRKWAWGALAAILCVVITLGVVNFWRSVVSVISATDESDLINQIYSAVLVDQLSSHPSLSHQRSAGGDVFVSFNGDICEPVQPQPLADKLSQAAVGRIKVRVDCDSALETYLWIEKGDRRVVAGYVCSALCGSGSSYKVLRLFGYTIILRDNAWVDQVSPPSAVSESS